MNITESISHLGNELYCSRYLMKANFGGLCLDSLNLFEAVNYSIYYLVDLLVGYDQWRLDSKSTSFNSAATNYNPFL